MVRISGNLATKSLTPIVKPSLLVQDSEYLETHLIVVPTGSRKEFLREYETLSPMVVPRSATQLAEDDEFALFGVTTFKKHSAEFLQKCREHKWTPRQYKYVEGGKEEEQRELDRVAREEKKVWGEALWLARTSWSESVMIWMHALTLRVFVETVLRYGLPLDYVSVLIKVRTKPEGKGMKAESKGKIQLSSRSPSAFTTLPLTQSGWRVKRITPLTRPLSSTEYRRPPNLRKRSRRRLTRHTHFSAVMRLAETRRARSPRTTQHCPLRSQLPVLDLATGTSTWHMCTMSSSFPKGACGPARHFEKTLSCTSLVQYASLKYGKLPCFFVFFWDNLGFSSLFLFLCLSRALIALFFFCLCLLFLPPNKYYGVLYMPYRSVSVYLSIFFHYCST